MLTIETRKLNVHYMDFPVLNDVDIFLQERKSYAIIGPSGEGKSTLLKTLDGLLPEHTTVTGDILYNGMSVDDFQKLRRERITYLLQDPMNQFNPVYTIGKQLLRAQEYTKEAISKEDRKERAISALKEMGLDESVYNLFPEELSGGMLQRVNIAIALLQAKPIVFLDEPTQGLEESLEKELIEKLIQENIEKNGILVYVTHSIRVAEKSDYIYCIKDGTVVEEGKTEDILNCPKSKFMQSLLEDSVYV